MDKTGNVAAVQRTPVSTHTVKAVEVSQKYALKSGFGRKSRPQDAICGVFSGVGIPGYTVFSR
jgi:hypothetical protein